MDKISVLMGIYNSPDKRAVTLAIESILRQTYTHKEIVICDDGSTDDTWHYLNTHWGDNPEVVLIKSKENKGLSSTLNLCLSHATGSYLGRQDADDYSAPERFSKQLAFLNAHPEFAWVGSKMATFDENGIYGERKLKLQPKAIDFIWGSPFAHATILIRRTALEEIGAYRVSNMTRRGQDYDLFMRLYAKGYKGYNMQESLYMVCEDKAAFSRRKFKVRMNIARIQLQGFRAMRLPWWSYIMILKTILAAFTPNLFLKFYVKNIRSIKI